MPLYRRYIHGLARHKLLIAVILASAGGVVFTSKDLFFTPIAAGTLAGIMVVALRKLWQTGRFSTFRHLRIAETASFAAVPVLFAAGLSVNADYMFHQAFGTATPAKVRNLTVDANIVNPAGKRIVLMRFRADRPTIEKLVKAQRFEVDRQTQQAWDEHDTWPAVLRLAFNDYCRFGGKPWTQIAPPSAPEFRKWLRIDHGTRTETDVLWNPDTNTAYVLYMVG